MSVFGANPIDPRTAQASLAAQGHARAADRSKPTTDATQRMRDASDQRIAGAESESAVRRSADEHAENESDQKRHSRRDGRSDEYRTRTDETDSDALPLSDAAQPAERGPAPAPAGGRLDVRA